MDKKLMFSSVTDQWATPLKVYDNVISHLNLDPQWDLAADQSNSKCTNFIDESQDSLKTKWPSGEVCWLNPPYGKLLKKFVDKCVTELEGSAPPSKVIWLLPARTDTKWFNSLSKHPNCSKVIFLKGRIKFGSETTDAPFPSVVIVMDSNHSGSPEVQFNVEVRK
ncbi:MAG: DNA N-6-adenine-methyltransferase [Cyanophyceae cyanobacterium]